MSARIGWWLKLCDLQRRQHAKEYPDVAYSLNCLAMLYEAQGQYAKAEPRYLRSLTISQKALGPEQVSRVFAGGKGP